MQKQLTDTTSAITLFVKAILRERKVPLEIGLPNDPFYSTENLARLNAPAERIKKTTAPNMG